MTALRRADTTTTVQPQTETRLLDWFDPIHDPGGVISRTVLRLDQLAAKRGVRLYPQTDFGALKTIVEPRRPLGTVMMPYVDTAYTALGAHNGIWVLGIDDQGEVVSTQAGRYFDFTGTTLAAEMQSFRFFYDDPSRHVTPECYCKPAPAAFDVNGTAVHSGTIWIRKDMRGPGEHGIVLSQLLGRITRLIAIAQWWPEYLFTFTKYESYRRGVVANFGWPHESFDVEWVFPDGRAPTSGMFWMTRDEMLMWAEDQVRQLAAA